MYAHIDTCISQVTVTALAANVWQNAHSYVQMHRHTYIHASQVTSHDDGHCSARAHAFIHGDMHTNLHMYIHAHTSHGHRQVTVTCISSQGPGYSHCWVKHIHGWLSQVTVMVTVPVQFKHIHSYIATCIHRDTNVHACTTTHGHLHSCCVVGTHTFVPRNMHSHQRN